MKRTLIGAVIALLAWAAIMLAMPFVGPSGRQVAVVGDTGKALRTIADAGGRVVAVRKNAVIAVANDDGGFVWRLYRNGAPLVIEGRIAAACFPVAKP
ncbi:hypothetical protein [Sphingopyxis sp.]|uniref:hypothetical protein n=1 Tax=Sphingopyxis sp. TaxID=1908224 RepID=UPI0035B018BE